MSKCPNFVFGKCDCLNGVCFSFSQPEPTGKSKGKETLSYIAKTINRAKKKHVKKWSRINQ